MQTLKLLRCRELGMEPQTYVLDDEATVEGLAGPISLEKNLSYTALSSIASNDVISFKYRHGFGITFPANLDYSLGFLGVLSDVHNFVIKKYGYEVRIVFATVP